MQNGSFSIIARYSKNTHIALTAGTLYYTLLQDNYR